MNTQPSGCQPLKVILLLACLVLAAYLPAGPAVAAPPEPEIISTDLGLSGADCYETLDLAGDAAAGRLYALCARGERGDANLTLVAVDIATGRQLAAATLATGAADMPATSGQLALDAPAGRLYVLSNALPGLHIYDAADLRPIGQLAGVYQVVPVPGHGHFFALSDSALTLYAAADLAPLATLPAGSAPLGVRLAVNPVHDHLYLAGGEAAFPSAAGAGIRVLRTADLALVATLPVTGVQALAVDSQADRLVALTGDGRLVTAEGATLAMTARPLEAPAGAGYVRFLVADVPHGRLHVIGEHNGRQFWQVLDSATLDTRSVYGDVPRWGAVALADDGDLLAVRSGGEIVQRYDPQDGPPAPAAIRPAAAHGGGECSWAGAGPGSGRLELGRRVVAAVVWPDTGWVYALDAGGGLHIMDGARLEVFVDCPGLLGTVHPGLISPDEVDMALDTQRGRLYVSDRVTGQTHVVDAATLELLGTVPIAGSLALDVASGQLFIADGDVYALDVAGPAVPPVIPAVPAIAFGQLHDAVAQQSAQSVVFDDGRLFVRIYVRQSGPASRNLAFYRAYDPVTLQPLGDYRLPLGTYQERPVVLPPGNRVWIAYDGGGSCYMGGALIISDCRQGLALYDQDYVELGQIKGLTGQLLADGDHIYLRRARDVLALDADWGDPLAALTVGGDLQGGALDAAHGRLYLWGWDRLATLATAQLLAAPPTGLPYVDATFQYPSPDVATDHTVFAALPATGVYRSTDDGQSWRLASRGLQRFFLDGLTFAPGWALDHTLAVTVGYEMAYRSTDAGDTWAPAGPPRLAFVSDRAGNKDIYTMPYHPDAAPRGYPPRRITDSPAQDDNPAWSPDGQRLVFQSDRAGNNDLWVVDYDGRNLVPLTSHPADDVLPAWSPDGGRIAFTSLRDGNPDIYLIDAPSPGQPGDEASVRRLTDHPAGDWRPAWSPDGRRIAFTSTRSQGAGDPAGDDNEIFVLTVPLTPEDAPSDLIQLTRNAVDDRDPAWQLSGDTIYYLSNAAGNFDICSMQSDGSGPLCLTDTLYDEYHVATLSDTGRILYVTRQTGRDDVYFMEIAGRFVQRLTGGPDNAGAPAWSPVLADLVSP